MDEIGPWVEELRQPAPKAPRKVRTFQYSRLKEGARLWEKRRKAREVKAPQTVQVSPVSFRSPEFRLFVPAHAWKPLTPANLRPKPLTDHFGVYQSSRPLSAAHVSFDITTVKKTLERLSRAATKSPPRDPSSFSQPNSGPLLKLTPISEGAALRAVIERSPRSHRASGGPSRQYKRRVKEVAAGKLSYPEYDQLAENLTEQLAILATKRPKTSQNRQKSPTRREANKEELRATLSQIVS